MNTVDGQTGFPPILLCVDNLGILNIDKVFHQVGLLS